MCLSSAYVTVDGKQDALITKNVTSVSIEGDSVVLYDLLGEKTEVIGKIKRVDFIKNSLVIKTA
ncbi:MAG: CooT family nickel-binding protein [Coriobacteriales bacterium]|jgi:predicted RNA-binding protein|nr:CooT family nickel-binding protein [Coriobacteriales bacterium]